MTRPTLWLETNLGIGVIRAPEIEDEVNDAVFQTLTLDVRPLNPVGVALNGHERFVEGLRSVPRPGLDDPFPDDVLDRRQSERALVSRNNLVPFPGPRVEPTNDLDDSREFGVAPVHSSLAESPRT